MSSLDPCLAVIPARGGSKGLPGKNVRPLGGLPLLVHSLRCAALVPRLGRVVVSTDSEPIAAIARAAGADVPFLRPAELATDQSPMMPVLAHALAEIEGLCAHSFGSVLLLDPTSPGRLPEDIERAFALLEADPAAAGVIACSRPRFNPFWVGVVERDGYMAPAFEAAPSYRRRQDVPLFLRINGALYLWRSSFVRTASDDWSIAPHRALEIPEERALSIDDLWEFQIAELMLSSGLLRLPWLEGVRR